MKHKYIIELTPQERSELEGFTDAGGMAAHNRRHARMLLRRNQGENGPGRTDIQSTEAVRGLCDGLYPGGEHIVGVIAQLNTPGPAKPQTALTRPGFK